MLSKTKLGKTLVSNVQVNEKEMDQETKECEERQEGFLRQLGKSIFQEQLNATEKLSKMRKNCY